MNKERLTIGELSRRTGVSVRTLRFWSDAGIVPPAGRRASGYRVYGEEAVLRLDLVRTLREAGLGLDAIKKVLRRDTSLADALRLHLAAVEAHASSLSRVAAALRAALRAGKPTESDVRRLCAVTRLTNEERKAVIERFYARVSEGIPVDDAWQKKMIEASAPKLPDNATPEQLDAWIELAELVADPTFVERLRDSAKEVWGRGLDLAALRKTNEETATAAATARASGAAPESAAGRAVAEGYVAGIARATGKPADAKLKREIYDRFAKHDPRAARYWELVAIMSGTKPPVGNVEDWKFVQAAVARHLAKD
jgi:DNA-binding transcriptional MerR regulator